MHYLRKFLNSITESSLTESVKLGYSAIFENIDLEEIPHNIFSGEVIAYHGSPSKSITMFNTDGRGKTKGTGVFFSDSASIANTYAGNGKVYTVKLNFKNALVIDADGANWNSIDLMGNARGYLLVNPVTGDEYGYETNKEDANYKLSDLENDGYNVVIEPTIDPDNAYSTDDIARIAKENGFDGLIIHNVIDSKDNWKTNELSSIYVIFDNQKINLHESGCVSDLPHTTHDPSAI